MTPDDRVKMYKVIGWLRPAIIKQKNSLKKQGKDTTWEVFCTTQAWQDAKSLVKHKEEFETLYKLIWESIE